MEGPEIRSRVAGMMPGPLADLEQLVGIPSVAFTVAFIKKDADGNTTWSRHWPTSRPPDGGPRRSLRRNQPCCSVHS
jgi:hypothetical protein